MIVSKWKCEICGNEFDNFHAQGFDRKIYCPLCYFKKKYENAVANPETSAEEKKRVSIENQLVREFSYLEKYPNIYYYNSVEELIQKIT